MKTLIIKNVLIIIVLFLASSCIKEPPYTYSYFTIVNESNHNLAIRLFNRNFDFKFQNDSIHLLSNDSIGFSRSEKESISYPFPHADSVYILFNDSKLLLYKIPLDGSRNILDYESYSGGMIKEYEYRFRYVITEQDYFDAIGKK